MAETISHRIDEKPRDDDSGRSAPRTGRSETSRTDSVILDAIDECRVSRPRFCPP
jgi:hypothetical protein